MEKTGAHAAALRATLPLLAAAALIATAAGCGGGGEHSLSKAQVIKQGSAICRRAEQRVNALPPLTSPHPFATGTSPQERERARTFVLGYADALETSRQGLLKLDAPSDGKTLLDGYIDGIETVVQKLRAAAVAAPEDVEPQVTKAFALFDSVSKKTASYGFPKGVCGSGSST
jgi:hypothetical protein